MQPWSLLDLATRQWWRLTGRRIDPAGTESWLQAPTNRRGEVGDAWLDDLVSAGLARPDGEVAGLVPDLAALDGPRFAAERVAPQVRTFYERTAAHRMDVWTQWSPLLAPGGELIARFFGRRVKQLALPVQPLAVSRGMTSAVRGVDDVPGGHRGTAWLRTLRSDGSTVFSGFYRVGRVPGSPQPHVSVAFPLEEGAVHVMLTPRVGDDGSLWLRSRSHRFGHDGAYVMVRSKDRWWAAMPPLAETFHVFVDDEGVLRTDHWLRFCGVPALRLHYRIDRP
ncbi:hypothetical protein ACQBAU_14290 [Propionibacteriaceae bacterium Y2011]